MEHANYAQILSQRIHKLRRENGLTQEALAQQLGLSFQAVSKWENGQSCPDIALLPLLADIFNVSVDSLFGRETAAEQPDLERPVAEPVFSHCPEFPWPDDSTLRGVVAWGHKILWHEQMHKKRFTFDAMREQYTWLLRYSPLNVECKMSLHVEGDVQGDANAGTSITCANIGSDASSGTSITCQDIGGDASAGTSINCADIDGDANAGVSINCANVSGDASAGLKVSIKGKRG